MHTLRLRIASAIAALLLAAPSAPVAMAVSHAFTPDLAQIYSKPVSANAAAHFSCQDNVIDTGAPRCYDPATIAAAYGFTGLQARGLTGAGRTIVIVDFYDNPYIEQDLQLFDATFGLPDPTFHKVLVGNHAPFDFSDGNQVGWSGEISLDVQWAHAMAPGAAITLVLAKSSDDGDINQALRYAVNHNLGDVISMSFGEGEACMSDANLAFQHETFKRAVQKGITLVASAGDDGAAQGTQAPDACDFGGSFFKSASTPASDPLVTGVGGTTLFAQDPAAGKPYESERAWSDLFSGSDTSDCFPPADFGCSGGGFSTLFDRPAYQAGVPNTNRRHRGVPDVSYNAGVDGGVLTHWGVGLQAYYGLDPATPILLHLRRHERRRSAVVRARRPRRSARPPSRRHDQRRAVLDLPFKQALCQRVPRRDQRQQQPRHG